MFIRTRTTVTRRMLLGTALGAVMLLPTRPSAASSPAVRKPLSEPEELEAFPSDGGRDYDRLAFEKSPYLLQFDFGIGLGYEVVITGSRESSSAEAMIPALRRIFVPNKVLLYRPDGDSPEITKIATYTRNQKAPKGQATAYVCRNHRCKLPTADPSAMAASLFEEPASPERGKKTGQ